MARFVITGARQGGKRHGQGGPPQRHGGLEWMPGAGQGVEHQATGQGSHDQHMEIVDLLRESGEPAIVLAASGMCSGGRIVNYLKALLDDSRTDIVFVGYQAEGTPGRQIQEYGPRGGYVVLDHQRYDIRAQVHTLGGYSAHADQRELLEFLQTTVGSVRDVRLVHGEAGAKAALATAIERSGLITGAVV